MTQRLIKLFLRFAISAGFLSAVADRFGWWSASVSAWGNWSSFLDYTRVINPWVPARLIPVVGAMATGAEIFFALFLLVGFKTELFARLSGLSRPEIGLHELTCKQDEKIRKDHPGTGGYCSRVFNGGFNVS